MIHVDVYFANIKVIIMAKRKNEPIKMMVNGKEKKKQANAPIREIFLRRLNESSTLPRIRN